MNKVLKWFGKIFFGVIDFIGRITELELPINQFINFVMILTISVYLFPYFNPKIEPVMDVLVFLNVLSILSYILFKSGITKAAGRLFK